MAGHGKDKGMGEYTCPVCGTRWSIVTDTPQRMPGLCPFCGYVLPKARTALWQRSETGMLPPGACRILRLRIKELGTSQAALARDMGVSEQALSNYLRARRRIPTDVFMVLCARCSLDPEMVWNAQDPPNDEVQVS